MPCPRCCVFPKARWNRPRPVVAGIGSEYIEGVGRLDDRLLILLDLEALLGNTGKEAH